MFFLKFLSQNFLKKLSRELFLQIIFWGSFAVPIIGFFFAIIFFRQKFRGKNFLAGFFLLPTIIFSWARFIEPQIILLCTTKIPGNTNAKIAVISDLHLGIFGKNEKFLSRVIEKINAEKNLDAVLLAGDFIYYPEIEKISEIFTPLEKIEIPKFAVLGNHDVLGSGKTRREKLEIALKNTGVKILQNEIVQIGNLEILGVGELWVDENKTEKCKLLEKSTDKISIILAHNPDVFLDLPEECRDFLKISGHTHGGQIRIPFLYQRFIPTKGDFDRGFMLDENIFISSGLGEVGLPLRIFVPPRIDILKIEK